MNKDELDEFFEELKAKRANDNRLQKFLYKKGFWGYNLRAWLRPKNFLGLPGETKSRIRWKIQRMRKGYSTYDIWSFDTYLARVIAGGLEELRIMNNGHPANMTNDEWLDVLIEMEDGFRSYNDSGTIGEYEEMNKKLNKSLLLFSAYFKHLWD